MFSIGGYVYYRSSKKIKTNGGEANVFIPKSNTTIQRENSINDSLDDINL